MGHKLRHFSVISWTGDVIVCYHTWCLLVEEKTMKKFRVGAWKWTLLVIVIEKQLDFSLKRWRVCKKAVAASLRSSGQTSPTDTLLADGFCVYPTGVVISLFKAQTRVHKLAHQIILFCLRRWLYWIYFCSWGTSVSVLWPTVYHSRRRRLLIS